MRSVLSTPLTPADRAVGAIKVYSRVADAYGEEDEDLLRRFADQAAIFVSNLQTTQAATISPICSKKPCVRVT
jgi:GAF domain-containing protein